MDPSGDRQRVDDTGRRGRRLKWLQDGLEERRAYRKLKEEALDLLVKRIDFGMKWLWTRRETDIVLTIREDEEEDLNGYWMALKKRERTGN